MMVGNEDLGLSLTLGSSENHRRLPPLQLNFMPCPSPHPFLLHHKIQWSDLLASSAPGRGSPAVPLLRGIDVNRSVVAARESEEEEEEVGASSSPNSTLSSVSGKRGERDPAHLITGGEGGEEQETERGSSRCGISDEEDGEASRKKLRLSKDQSAVLEESFKEHSTLNPKQKLALARKLNLRPRQVEVWFQNRRARTKLKQTEVDCEYLKRCCENLTEENRRLQKEVAELRALKLSPHLFMHTTPPTTLTMCPSCERVASAATAAAIVPQPPDHRHRHRPIPIAAATPTSWSLLPLRASFMDGHPQNADHGGCMIFGSRMVHE